MVLEIASLAVSAIALLFAARLVYRQLHAIAAALDLPPFFVASILVALSTCIPELFVGITSALHGDPVFALGNVIGGNIFDLTFVAGVVLLVSRRKANLAPHIDQQRLVLTFAASGVPLIALADGTISRTDGAVLILVYALYVVFSIFKRRHAKHDLRVSERNLIRALALFFIGIAILIGTSYVLFHAAQALSVSLNVPDFIIGVFALSFSTTLPEFAFGIKSALERKPELSLADIVGSSVVNACGVLGVVALIAPIHPANVQLVLFDCVFFIAVMILFYRLVWQRTIAFETGFALVAAYAVFLFLNFAFA